MFRAGPKSQWACGSKPSAAKSRGVPQRRTSGLSLSSSPTGVVASTMFGMESMSASMAASASARASPRAVSFSLIWRTVSLVALASSVLPWPMSAPISFDSLLRSACRASSSAMTSRRCTSRAVNCSGEKEAWRFFIVSATSSRCSRTYLMSSMGRLSFTMIGCLGRRRSGGFQCGPV